MRLPIFSLAAALVLAIPVAAQATTALDYNVLVSGNFTSTGSDTEGRIAAGGNITVSGYDIALKNVAGAGQYAAVAGGSITVGGGGGTIHGNTLAASYSGNPTMANGGAKVVTSAANPSPIAIASEMSRITALSADFHNNAATYGTVGTASIVYDHQLHVEGSSSTVNIFNITAAQLQTATQGINIFVPVGSVVLFNVSGTAASIPNTGASENTAYYSANYASNILFNFYEATTLSFSSVYGSVVAPLADIATSNGAIDGQIFAKSYSGSTQVNYYNLATPTGQTNLLARSVGAVPEPATWATMILGFGVIGGALRRQRAGYRAFA